MQEMEHSLPIGTKLDDRYKVISILGEGGFGITYKAHDEKLDCDVAIKEYLPGECAARTSDSVTVQPRTNRGDDYQYGLDKFLEEARTLAKFQHSNIVRVSNFIEQNGTAYLVMEFADGVPLDEWLKKKADAVDEAILLKIISPLLQGLAEVHKANLMHRDIKPGNIFLRKKGGPLLIDFGAARQALGEHSRSISAIVSMGYAPPEQYTTRGKQGPYTDLYAVGAVMYKLITGETPVESPDRSHDIHEGEPDPLVPAAEAGKGKMSDWLLQITDQLLNISPKQRPQNAEDVLSAIENKTSIAVDSASSIPATPKQDDNKTRVVKSTERFSKQKSEKSKPVEQQDVKTKSGFSFAKVAIVFVVIAALAGGGYYFQSGQKASQYRSLAEAQAELGKVNDTRRLIDQAVSISGKDAADKFIIELAERKAKEISDAIARKKAEEEAKRLAELRAKQEAEAQALREEQARKEVAAQARREQEAKERREAQAQRDAEEKAKREAQAAREEQERREAQAARQAQAQRDQVAQRNSLKRRPNGNYSNVKLRAPDIAENGAVVPVTVGLNLVTGDTLSISSDDGCRIFAASNTGQDDITLVSTRVKMRKTGELVVRVNNQEVARKLIKVTIGGMGAMRDDGVVNKIFSSVRDFFIKPAQAAPYGRDICLASLSTNGNSYQSVQDGSSRGVKMRASRGSVKVLMTHPMETGLRRNKRTGKYVPAHYLQNAYIGVNGREAVRLYMGAALSRNPYFGITISGVSSGNSIDFGAADNKGGVLYQQSSMR